MRKYVIALVCLLTTVHLFAQPVIQSFVPASAAIGTVVTLTGTGFSTTTADNIVYFGAVKATVSTATATQLTVIVPAGATYKPISVTTNNLTGYSPLPFTTTFANDNPQLTTSSFSLTGSYPTGTYPSAIEFSDLNDDGRSDIITVNSVGNSISVLKNTTASGTIAFAAKVDFNTGTDPKRISVGDLDGDGKTDIVITNFNAGNASSISIFRNSSSGGTISFDPKIDIPTGNGSVGVFVTDLNNDGKPDIVVSSGNSGFFSVFKNVTAAPGTISMAAKQDYTLLMHPDNITVADLDKDGYPDVITSNFSNSSITVYRNTSTGGVISLTLANTYPVDNNPNQLIPGDFDGDGKIDIAVGNYGSNTISFLKNNTNNPGSISLGAAQNYSLGILNIVAADLNGDGKTDLCVGRGGSAGQLSIIENTSTGAGTIAFGTNVDFATGNFDTYVAAGDLDGDGRPELAAVNTTLNTVSTIRNAATVPVITSVSAPTGNSGTAVSINGSRFTGATAVKFGGTPANSFTVVSATKIDAVIGGGASGDITVTTPSGTASIPGFNFIPQITADGPATFCNHESITLTSTAIANNQWYKDGQPINGATATTLPITTAGVYTVKTTSNGITTISPTGVAATVITVPLPVITINASNDLVSSSPTGNQWYTGGSVLTVIPGANGQTYHPAQSGSYVVKVTANNCTSDASVAVVYTVTGIVNLGNDQYIKFYPNPVVRQLFVNWNITGTPTLNVDIIDMQGRQVLGNKNAHTGATIDLSPLPAGIYFVKIYNDRLKINQTIKIIKQ